MNFAGHVEVARTGPGPADDGARSPAFLLGAILPDLAAMGRFRLLQRPTDGELATGIDFHHRTDDAFHRHPWFRSASDTVSRDLDRAGVPRGAARACGHVGVELLLDGHLLLERSRLAPTVQGAIDLAGDRIDELVPLVDRPHRERWRHHLRRVSTWTVPDDYHRPTAVAARLERILSHRPRLALPPSGVAAVAEALDGRQESVTVGADDLIADLRRELAFPG